MKRFLTPALDLKVWAFAMIFLYAAPLYSLNPTNHYP